jgi:hypothetical protein
MSGDEDTNEINPQPSVKKIQWKKARPWPMLRKEALYGIIGEVTNVIADESEADRAAILVTLLAGIGNIAGTIPRITITNTPHPARLFAVIVGGSSEGVKGTSHDDTLPFLNMVDSEFDNRTRSGFGSGEGIISLFADPVEKKR